MKSNAGESVIQLLVEVGVLDGGDVRAVQSRQKEALLLLMVERRVLLKTEIGTARDILSELMEGSNHTKHLSAKTSLVSIITNNLHRRMATAGERVRVHKERVTGNVPAVAMALKLEGG